MDKLEQALNYLAQEIDDLHVRTGSRMDRYTQEQVSRILKGNDRYESK